MTYVQGMRFLLKICKVLVLASLIKSQYIKILNSITEFLRKVHTCVVTRVDEFPWTYENFSGWNSLCERCKFIIPRRWHVLLIKAKWSGDKAALGKSPDGKMFLFFIQSEQSGPWRDEFFCLLSIPPGLRCCLLKDPDPLFYRGPDPLRGSARPGRGRNGQQYS